LSHSKMATGHRPMTGGRRRPFLDLASVRLWLWTRAFSFFYIKIFLPFRYIDACLTLNHTQMLPIKSIYKTALLCFP
jgi:hypothetical protein